MKTNCEMPIEIIKKLDEVKSLTIQALEMIGISPENKKIFYKRTKDGKSILGIKLVDGDDKDDDNYMLNVAQVNIINNEVLCNVFLHSSAKCCQETIILSRFIAESITNFFNVTEKTLHNINKDEMEIKVTFSLGNSNLYENDDALEIDKTNQTKENKYKGLVKKLFKSKNKNS